MKPNTKWVPLCECCTCAGESFSALATANCGSLDSFHIHCVWVWQEQVHSPQSPIWKVRASNHFCQRRGCLLQFNMLRILFLISVVFKNKPLVGTVVTATLGYAWGVWKSKFQPMTMWKNCPMKIKILPDSNQPQSSNRAHESKIVYSQFLSLTESEFVFRRTFSQGVKN